MPLDPGSIPGSSTDQGGPGLTSPGPFCVGWRVGGATRLALPGPTAPAVSAGEKTRELCRIREDRHVPSIIEHDELGVGQSTMHGVHRLRGGDCIVFGGNDRRRASDGRGLSRTIEHCDRRHGARPCRAVGTLEHRPDLPHRRSVRGQLRRAEPTRQRLVRHIFTVQSGGGRSERRVRRVPRTQKSELRHQLR